MLPLCAARYAQPICRNIYATLMAQKYCNITESRYGIPEWNMAIRDFVALRFPHPDATARVAGVPFSLLGGFGTGRYNPGARCGLHSMPGTSRVQKPTGAGLITLKMCFPIPWP
jgi:hypothetical protein